MKYIIYARVSPHGGDYSERETSVPMQIDICKEYVKMRGGEVVKALSDEFFSGKDTNRPSFRELLSELESGNAEWDTLLVYKLSRMSRSKRDAEDIFCKLAEHGKGFACATEQWDFSTPVGRAMMSIMQAFNQLEREQTAENTRNKMISIAKNGMWPTGRPPFGYRRGKTGDNRLYPDPEKSELVKQMFHLYGRTDKPTGEIVSMCKGILSKQQFFHVLRDRTYLGMICYAGEEYSGQHEPLIDPDEFDRVQKRLPDPRTQTRPRAQKYPFLLAGLVFCSCGRHLTPATAKSGQFAYYQCTDSDCRIRVSAPKLENAVEQYLASINITPDIIEKARMFDDGNSEERRNKAVKELSLIASQKKKINAEKDRVFAMLMEPGLNQAVKTVVNQKIEEIEYRQTLLQGRSDFLNAELKKIEGSGEVLDSMISSLKTLADRFRRGTLEHYEKRSLVLTYINKIELHQDGVFEFVPMFPAGSTICEDWGGRPDLNRRPPGPQPGALTN